MNSATLPVLDLAALMPQPAARQRHVARELVLVLTGLALILGLWLGYSAWSSLPPAQQVVRIELGDARRVAALNVDDRTQILAEGNDAQARNEAVPFAGGTVVPMGAFHIAAPAPSAANALRCLTQAIYYEAATEPLEGRRAVAQVVLNRVRHPAYPKSVCGVVYQGSQLSTGCQFSFTCDGSLLRQPMAGPWRTAETIAREALAGRVAPEVGTATHYHADYVLPRWAFEMDKITRLGRHLFYRFGGTWGRPGFYNSAYNPREVIPALDFARLRARLVADHAGEPAVETFTPGLTVAPHVTDRHADNDVGGRLDMTRGWRLNIPDPTATSGRYQALVHEESGGEAARGQSLGQPQPQSQGQAQSSLSGQSVPAVALVP